MERLQALTKSLKFAEVTKNRKLQGQAHHQFGCYYYSIGKYDQAIDHFEVYKTIAKETGNKKGEGIALSSLGVCYRSLGQYDKAIRYFEMRLIVAKKIGDKQNEGAAYGNIGACYSLLNQQQRAIEHQEICLTIAKEIGDEDAKGKACGKLGTYYFFLSQYNKAIEYLEMSLVITKNIGDRKNEASGYGNLGNCYTCLGQYNKAISYHEMSLAILKEIGDKNGEGTAYGNIGTSYSYLCQYDKALKYQEMSLTIAKEIGDKKGEETAYGNLGTCCGSLGQYDKAIKYLEMRLTIAKEIGDKQGEGSAYGNTGNCYKYLGKYDEAIKYQEMHLTITNEIGDKRGEGSAYTDLGICYSSLGQYNQAVKYQELGLTVAQEIGDKSGELTAYNNLGTCYSAFKQYDQAIRYQKMCLAIAKEIGDKLGEGRSYGNLGAYCSSLGQYEQALKYQDMNLNIAQEIGDKQGEGNAYGNIGTTYSFLGQYDKAIKYREMQLNIAKQMEDKNIEGSIYGQLGMFCISLDQFDKAENCFKKGVECYEELFKNVPKMDEHKISFIDTFIYISRLLIDSLLVQRKFNEALVFAERGRSRALVDLMLTNSPAPEVKVSDVNEIRKVVKDLKSTVLFFTLRVSWFCVWVIQPNGDVISRIRNFELSQQTKRIYAKDDSLSPENFNSVINRVIKMMKPRGDDRCEDRSLSFLYGQEASKCANTKAESVLSCTASPVNLMFSQEVLPQPRLGPVAPMQQEEIARLTSSAREDSDEVTPKSKDPDKPKLDCLLRDLHRFLLEPVRQFLVEANAIVVPEGLLALVPFSALMDENGHYLADSLRVRLILSIAAAKMIRERSIEQSRRGRPLVMGDPDVGQVPKGGKLISVPRLSHANKEVDVVGQFLNVQPFVGEKATKKKFLQKVESATLIHIAAHGDVERGEILLAPHSRTNRNNIEDVMLQISDLEGKRINAKLVVLSCCHSGRGEVKGEGVIGIARAFLGAGARAVLASLWAVDDRATLWFMSHFYHHLRLGESTSEAINEAIKAVKLKGFDHPRYWAPFVLLGEDVTPFGKS